MHWLDESAGFGVCKNGGKPAFFRQALCSIGRQENNQTK
jgi:hypothetical protein